MRSGCLEGGNQNEMPARRVSVRKIREILRLLWECELSHEASRQHQEECGKHRESTPALQIIGGASAQLNDGLKPSASPRA